MSSEYDVVARLGGDEFVVVLKDIHCPKDEDADELIDNANAALYQAKHNGRGCFSYYLETNEGAKPLGFNTVFCAGCVESNSG